MPAFTVRLRYRREFPIQRDPSRTAFTTLRMPHGSNSGATTSSEFQSTPVACGLREGSVSDGAPAGRGHGVHWAATDSGVLDRTLERATEVEALYRPYRWTQQGGEIRVIFRDHYLSDLIGFVYSRMEAREAVQDFLGRIGKTAARCCTRRDALVPIILDGENAWETPPERTPVPRSDL